MHLHGFLSSTTHEVYYVADGDVRSHLRLNEEVFSFSMTC